MTSLSSEIPALAAPDTGQSKTNTNAIVSLVAGLLTWLIGWLGSCSLGGLVLIHPAFGFAGWCPSIIGLISTVAGIVTGHLALSQINRAPTRYTGRSLALTGLVLNYLSLALAIGALCLFVLSAAGFITYALTLPE